MQAIIGREVLIGSFLRSEPNKLVGEPQRARVVRATRAFLTLQRYACSGWHTNPRHGFVTVDWNGMERSKQGILETRVHPDHMAELRALAGIPSAASSK